MAKVSVGDIQELGFTSSMYNGDDTEFDVMVTGIIAEQSPLLAARLGAQYNSSDPLVQALVKRAEKCLCGAEMVQRRVNVLLGNASGAGQELDIKNEQRQKADYLQEAERLILRLASQGVTDGADFATGALVSGPYDDAGS